MGFKDECGVVGVYGHTHAAELARRMLFALQHRGQEGAGIYTSDGEALHGKKGMGRIDTVFQGPNSLNKLRGNSAIGHVRYSTAGGNELCNVQPFCTGELALAHNGNVPDTEEIERTIAEQGVHRESTSDSEIILHLISIAPGKTIVDRIIWSLSQVRGSYSLTILSKDSIIAVRDPFGFRPLVMGKVGEKTIVFASETCALDIVGATFIREVEPGEIIIVGQSSVESYRLPTSEEEAQCLFERVYFSRPDSEYDGEPLQQTRERMGQILAQECPADADIVIAVPDSGIPAARGFAKALNIPYEVGFIRNHYIGRTFIEPLQEDRYNGVILKLNPIRNTLREKRVVVVDDSIVRGTTSKIIVAMLFASGAKEVHLRISCPPTKFPCFYGVDTPNRNKLIAANKTVEQIREFIGCTSLAYLSLAGLKNAAGNKTSFCSACYDGQYPIKVKHLLQIQAAI